MAVQQALPAEVSARHDLARERLHQALHPQLAPVKAVEAVGVTQTGSAAKSTSGGHSCKPGHPSTTSLKAKLPEWLKAKLASPPRAGQGVNNWLFTVSRHLHKYLPASKIVALLVELTRDCGGAVPLSEIKRQVNCSRAGAKRSWSGPRYARRCSKPRPKWPVVNQELRAAIVRDCGGLAELQKLSTPQLDPRNHYTEGIIDLLFPGNPLLCCGLSKYQFGTRSREKWRGQLDRLQLIVPSPMIAKKGLTQEGKLSEHSLENTGPRRFLVVEFDSGAHDEHAAILIHLAKFAPLICAVYSGGKSLHGWFHVHGEPEEKVLKLFRYAVSLGADRALWTRSQFVRMPDGERDTGRRQRVVFVNSNFRKSQ